MAQTQEWLREDGIYVYQQGVMFNTMTSKNRSQLWLGRKLTKCKTIVISLLFYYQCFLIHSNFMQFIQI